MQLKKFVEERAAATGREVTLACGHNSYCETPDVFDDVIKLMEDVLARKLEKHREVSMFNLAFWEFSYGANPRVGLVIPANYQDPY